MIHQGSHFFFGYLIYSGVSFIDLKTCIYFNLVPIAALNFSVFMILFISVDRLFIVLFPIRYQRFNMFIYITIYVSIIMVFNVYILRMMVIAAADAPSKITTCVIIDAMPEMIGQIWFIFCLVANILTITCYFGVWITLKARGGLFVAVNCLFRVLYRSRHQQSTNFEIPDGYFFDYIFWMDDQRYPAGLDDQFSCDASCPLGCWTLCRGSSQHGRRL